MADFLEHNVEPLAFIITQQRYIVGFYGSPSETTKIQCRKNSRINCGKIM
jgi:hypothetical protein